MAVSIFPGRSVAAGGLFFDVEQFNEVEGVCSAEKISMKVGGALKTSMDEAKGFYLVR